MSRTSGIKRHFSTFAPTMLCLFFFFLSFFLFLLLGFFLFHIGVRCHRSFALRHRTLFAHHSFSFNCVRWWFPYSIRAQWVQSIAEKKCNVPTMNMSLIEMILFDKWIENFGCDVGNNWVLLRSWNVNEMTIHFYLAPNGCSKVEFGYVDNSAATLDWAILRLHFFVRIYQKYDSFFTQTLKIFRIQFDSHMGQAHQRNKLFNVQTNC